MARSQARLRDRRGFDIQGVTAYARGERSAKTNEEQNAAARAAGFNPAPPAGQAVPTNSVIPTITGTPTQGQTLTAGNGTWAGTPSPTLTRQWLRGTTPIGGATGATYVVQVGDVGSVIRLRVTGTNSWGVLAVNSNPTATVT